MSTWVIGDIHGCLDEWLTLRDRILEYDKKARFILVGDIIDRGPKVIETCEWMLKNISKQGRYQLLIGNHEFDKVVKFDYMVSRFDHIEPDNTDWWCYYKYDFDDSYGSVSKFRTFSQYQTIIDFFRNLHYYKDITVNNQRFIIVHADLPFIAIDTDNKSLVSEANMSYRTKEHIVWSRDCVDFTKIENTILINGHTPTLSQSAFRSSEDYYKYHGKIYKTFNRYNIDCGLVYRDFDRAANLAALCLEDLSEVYLY